MGAIYNMYKALEADDNSNLSQTDIFGDSDKPGAKNTKDNLPTNTPDNEEESVPNTEELETPATLGDDNNSEETPSDDEDSDTSYGDDTTMNEEDIPEEDNTEITLKNNLRENMIKLHTIIKNNITLVSEVLSDLSDQNKIAVMIKVSLRLSDCSDILYRIITEEFSSNSYENLTKKYVAITKIFDICTEMMKCQFEKEEDK